MLLQTRNLHRFSFDMICSAYLLYGGIPINVSLGLSHWGRGPRVWSLWKVDLFSRLQRSFPSTSSSCVILSSARRCCWLSESFCSSSLLLTCWLSGRPLWLNWWGCAHICTHSRTSLVPGDPPSTLHAGEERGPGTRLTRTRTCTCECIHVHVQHVIGTYKCTHTHTCLHAYMHTHTHTLLQWCSTNHCNAVKKSGELFTLSRNDFKPAYCSWL